MTSKNNQDLATIIGYAVACSLIGAAAGLAIAFVVTLIGSIDPAPYNGNVWEHWLGQMGMAAMMFGAILGAIFGAQFGFRATK
jgi:amino acid transporter